MPRKGWTCTGIEDLGELDAVCEMCESQEIRYAHYMEHPNYSDELRVGCVCARRMEQDYEAPQRRERTIKNASKRRRNWLKRNWRTSKKGNLYLNTDGFNVVVFGGGNAWGFKVTGQETSGTFTAYRQYTRLDKAKLAAFDQMIYMKEQEARQREEKRRRDVECGECG